VSARCHSAAGAPRHSHGGGSFNAATAATAAIQARTVYVEGSHFMRRALSAERWALSLELKAALRLRCCGVRLGAVKLLHPRL
jgi:hypothetical protein